MSLMVKEAKKPAQAMKAIKTVLESELREVGSVKNWFTTKEGRIVMKCNDEHGTFSSVVKH